jgi:hypothetical protein
MGASKTAPPMTGPSRVTVISTELPTETEALEAVTVTFVPVQSFVEGGREAGKGGERRSGRAHYFGGCGSWWRGGSCVQPGRSAALQNPRQSLTGPACLFFSGRQRRIRTLAGRQLKGSCRQRLGPPLTGRRGDLGAPRAAAGRCGGRGAQGGGGEVPAGEISDGRRVQRRRGP